MRRNSPFYFTKEPTDADVRRELARVSVLTSDYRAPREILPVAGVGQRRKK